MVYKTTIEVSAVISNYIPHETIYVTTHPLSNFNQSMLLKGTLARQRLTNFRYDQNTMVGDITQPDMMNDGWMQIQATIIK